MSDLEGKNNAMDDNESVSELKKNESVAELKKNESVAEWNKNESVAEWNKKKSYRQAVIDYFENLGDTTDPNGTVTNKDILLRRVVEVAQNTNSLRDLLKLLLYLDDASNPLEEALEEFVDRLTPILWTYIAPSMRESVTRALQAECTALLKEAHNKAVKVPSIRRVSN